MRAAVCALLATGASALTPADMVHRAVAIMNINATDAKPNLGVINGRVTKAGEWEGTVMVTGSTGACDDSGLCSGSFIHPEIVMTAGHCCETGAKKAICGGKERPGNLLAVSKDMAKATFLNNDFCLLHLDRAVTNVPIYEVASSVSVGDATIVGYGVATAGLPQEGAGIQREGLVSITRVSGVDITITGRSGQEYQNACNGDSGGPIFVPGNKAGEVVVGGVTSRGSLWCPLNSNGIYTSAVESGNANLIREMSSKWLGKKGAVEPGQCPVSQCCYSMTC